MQKVTTVVVSLFLLFSSACCHHPMGAHALPVVEALLLPAPLKHSPSRFHSASCRITSRGKIWRRWQRTSG
ncbi:hypothetical protein [Geotalea toluenoxydans]|uniref:hypothetical protein n=1 Tax=Geotalea toluenoxydans TaxID=421624 RepID=UPI000B3156A2|nr:hypothetical protein [Geotalea toluenoxydans]